MCRKSRSARGRLTARVSSRVGGQKGGNLVRRVDVRELLELIPRRHILFGFAGSLPIGLGLMGFFAPPGRGALVWTGELAGPLVVLGAVMNLPLWYHSARAGLVIRRRMDEEPD